MLQGGSGSCEPSKPHGPRIVFADVFGVPSVGLHDLSWTCSKTLDNEPMPDAY